MADEDFEIDVYADTPAGGEHGDAHAEDSRSHTYDGEGSYENGHDHHQHDEKHDETDHSRDQNHNHDHDQGHDRSATATSSNAPQQGTKRKEATDDRAIDANATTALMISELNWWNTDDDIRGWARQANCEDELKDITFSEHKVNGKSRGQAYVEFTSQQAATALKHEIEMPPHEPQHGQKKPNVTYSNPNINPLKTTPKDAPPRGNRDGNNRAPSGPGYNNHNNMGGNYGGNNFRGRGNYGAPRGGMGGGYNNRNYGNNMNAFNGNMGFNPMGGGNFGGGFNRGGMGGMRGGPNMRGRGGVNNMMGPMGPMGGAMGPMGPMGGMPNVMNMMGGGMGGGMGGSFPGMPPHFNPGFFGGQNQGGGGNDWQNPHGAKRPRPE